MTSNLVNFSDFAVLQRGFDLPKQSRNAGSYPIVSSSGISGSHDSFAVKGPGVVTGRSGTIGLSFFVEDDFWPLNTTLYVKDFKGNNPKYVSLMLEKMGLAGYAGGSTVPSLNRNVLDKVEVYAPSLPEQRRTVDLIGALDDAIEAAKSKHQAAISVVDQMANSLPGEKNALANLLTTIDAGKSPSGVERTPLSGERAVLKVSAIGPNGFLPAEAKVVAPEVSLRDETRIEKDDVLLVRANGVISRVGATCIVKEDHPELFLCDKTLRLVPDRSSVMPHWLNIAMKSADVRSQIESLTGGSDMRNITQKSILQIEIPQPDMAIQETFADAFRGLDEGVELAEKHIATLNFLRTELLTALLSGAHEIPESYDSVMDLAGA